VFLRSYVCWVPCLRLETRIITHASRHAPFPGSGWEARRRDNSRPKWDSPYILSATSILDGGGFDTYAPKVKLVDFTNLSLILSLVRITEELLVRKSSGSGLENRN
jgi:hypothetical protein